MNVGAIHAMAEHIKEGSHALYNRVKYATHEGHALLNGRVQGSRALWARASKA